MKKKRYVMFLDDFIRAGGKAVPIKLIDKSRYFYRCLYRLEMRDFCADAEVDIYPEGARMVLYTKSAESILDRFYSIPTTLHNIRIGQVLRSSALAICVSGSLICLLGIVILAVKVFLGISALTIPYAGIMICLFAMRIILRKFRPLIYSIGAIKHHDMERLLAKL